MPSQSLVVIHNFDIMRMSVLPSETHAVLIVDPHAILSRPVAFQPLQLVRGRRRKVPQFLGAIYLDQTAQGNLGDLLESPDAPLLKDRPCILVAERTDHMDSVLRTT